MPKVVTFKEEPDIFDQIRKEQSDTQRSRYFDYLMQGESRRQSRMEEAKEDSRESFRLNLKKSAIAENTGNKTYEAMYRAELSKRSGLTNPEGTGSLDRTLNSIQSILGKPIPQYLDSTTIRAIIGDWEASLLEGPNSDQIDQQLLARNKAELGQLLNGAANLRKLLANSNTTLKGIPGALVADDGSPRGFQPMRNMFDYYASEFGEDPFTTKKIKPNQIPPKPSDQDIKESADQLEGVAGALEDDGVLDNVSPDSQVSGGFLDTVSNWFKENFTSPDINEDGSVTQEAYPGALSSVDQDAEAGDPEYITPLPSDNWRYDTSGTIDPPEGRVTSEDLPMENLPSMEPSLLGRPLSQQPVEIPGPSLMGRPLQPLVDDSPEIDYSIGTEINPGGETMQTVYPESLLKLSEGTEGYDMGGGEPELSGSIPMEGSPVISSPMDEEELRLQELGIQADLQRDQIERETNEGLMQLEQDHQRKLRTFMNQKNMQYSDMESIRDFAGKAALGLGSFLIGGPPAAAAAVGVASKGRGLWNFLRTLGKAKPTSRPLAVPPGARGRGFPSTPKPDPSLAIPPGARGRGFPSQPPKGDIDNLAVPPSLRGRGL